MTRAARGDRAVSKPERWCVDAGPADVATLTIPADAQRDRRFEIDCRFIVHAAAEADGPWHAMHVDVDGAREWSRRIHTHNLGSTDSLDVHFRRDVPSGRALRIVVRTEVHHAVRVGVVIEAEEN